MPRFLAVAATLLTLLLTATLGAAADRAAAPPSADWIPFDDPKVQALVKAINGLEPYQMPALVARTDSVYAHTPEDVAPYGGVAPFNRFFLEQMVYAGPGRAIPEPEHVDTVKVGFIGPIQSTVSAATGGKSHEELLGLPMLHGCQLAVEEWNARGGYLKRKIPFELVVSNDNGLWGSSGNEIIKQAYQDNVWGMLGTIDGANSHIAIRVALKAEVLMINSGDTDPTYIETNIPWVARVIGDDRQQAYLLTDYWYRKLGLKRVAIIRASNRYGRFGVREINDSSRRLEHPIPIEMAYKVGQKDFSLELARIQAVAPDAVVHWGDARDAAAILNQMRALGMKQPFFGSDRTVSDEFVSLAGKNAEGVIAGYPWDPNRSDPRLERFRKAYLARFGVAAETYATHAYDGMNMLLWAIEVGGLNRAKIRDVVAYLPYPWPGVTGDIPFSAVLDDTGETYLARLDKGHWSYLSRAQLKIPSGILPARERVVDGR